MTDGDSAPDRWYSWCCFCCRAILFNLPSEPSCVLFLFSVPSCPPLSMQSSSAQSGAFDSFKATPEVSGDGQYYVVYVWQE